MSERKMPQEWLDGIRKRLAAGEFPEHPMWVREDVAGLVAEVDRLRGEAPDAR